MALKTNLRKRKSREEIIFDEPSITPVTSGQTIFSIRSEMVCKMSNNELRFICMSDKGETIRSLTLNILDHCIDKLHILSGGRSVTGKNSHLAFFDEILKERLAVPKTAIYDPIYDIKTGDPFKVAFRTIQMNKIYNDSAKLKEFIHSIRNELKDFHSFQMFRNVIFDFKKKTQEAHAVFKEMHDNHNKLKELKDVVVNCGRDSRLQIRDANEAYSVACDTVQKLFFINIVKLRYAKAYENSRCEQNKIKCEREFRVLENILSKYMNKIQIENRVHEEISTYIIDNQKVLRNKMKSWMNKYNSDMEINQFKLIQIKDRLDGIKKDKSELIYLFADHKNFIEEFKDYKEKKRIIDEEKQRLVDAATKIQAWWRGNMYRHQLGPYNPNKSKKGKGKKKKKNK